MVEIVGKDEPVLRAVAKEVPQSLIGTAKLENILERMKQALHSQDDGVAIAAPQIGESLRIFVVSGKVENLLKGIEDEAPPADSVYINPRITKTSREKKIVEEGCLSVRWLYGKVKRASKATVEALNGKGEKFTRGGTGLLAQIFQHEIDHLDGVLFIDKATDIEEMEPPKKK